MKYLVFTIAASLLSIGFAVEAEAQILNRLKKKAKQAAEQKAEEKVAERVQHMSEQMVEKSWNSIFGEMEGDSATGRRLPFAMSSNVATEELYEFDTITTMEIETIKKDGSSDPPVIMDMHFNRNEMYTGTKLTSEEMNPENGELFIIYDLKNSAMLMLMSNESDKFSFAYDWKQALHQAEAVADSQYTEEQNWDEIDEWNGYSKIGTKNILGYDCEGYRSENDGQTTEIWVSRNAEVGMHNLFKANANAKQIKGKIPDNYPQGMVMELTNEDLKSGEKTIMKVTNINNSANVRYAMADYPAMSFKPPKSQ